MKLRVDDAHATGHPRVLVRRSVADLVADPRHAGPLDGADAAGEAREDDRVVRIGVWTDGRRVARARFRATTCASLLAFAEAACALLEGGVAPSGLGPALRAAVRGVHPDHLDRAELVLSAVRAAIPDATERT